MKASKILCGLLAAVVAATGGAVLAQESAVLAQQELEAFLEDWNRADNEALREHLSFPHVTHGAGNLVIVDTSEEFFQDFDLLRSQGWRRSTFDNFEVLQVSETKVNLLVDFRRYNADDEVISDSQVFYVMTLQDGRWGMQYRSGGPRPEQLDASLLESAEAAATVALREFFAAFNAADNEALFAVNHVPQAVLFELNFLHGENRGAAPVTVNFERLRDVEDWSRSEAENITPVHVTPNKVIFEFQFSRYNSNGERYRTVPAVWVITRQGEKWGVEFRSLMTPSFSL